MKILSVIDPGQTVRIAIGIVDGQKQDGNAQGYAKAGHENIVVDHLDNRAGTRQQQKFPDHPHGLPAELLGVEDAAQGNGTDIAKGQKVHGNIERTTDIDALLCYRKQPSVPMIGKDNDSHDRGRDTRNGHAAIPSLVSQVPQPVDIAIERNGYQNLQQIQNDQQQFQQNVQIGLLHGNQDRADKVQDHIQHADNQEEQKCLAVPFIQLPLPQKMIEDQQQEDHGGNQEIHIIYHCASLPSTAFSVSFSFSLHTFAGRPPASSRSGF